MDDTQIPPLKLYVSEELRDEIDKFRFRNLYPSRAMAITFLLEDAVKRHANTTADTIKRNPRKPRAQTPPKASSAAA